MSRRRTGWRVIDESVVRLAMAHLVSKDRCPTCEGAMGLVVEPVGPNPGDVIVIPTQIHAEFCPTELEDNDL